MNTAGGPEQVTRACSPAWSPLAHAGVRMNSVVLSLLKPSTTALMHSLFAGTKVKPSFLQKVLLQLPSVRPGSPT